MTNLVGNPIAGRDQQIADLAYKFWEQEGYPEGRAEEHWMRAAAIVDETASGKPKLKLVAGSKSRRKAS